MRAQFEEQFARISKEFDAVFKQLFGGGKGTLELDGYSDTGNDGTIPFKLK